MVALRINFLFTEVILCFLLCFSTSTVQSSDTSLPSDIVPTKYDLHITTNIHRDVLAYFGNVSINLIVKNPTEKIVLHSKDLSLTEVFLFDLQKNKEIDDLKFKVDGDILEVFSEKNPLQLEADDQFTLKINFEGIIQSEPYGFFKPWNRDDPNGTLPIAATRFEPNFARTAFPCFDEPTFKAKFHVRITHGSNYLAASNMPIDGTPKPSENGEMLTTSFLETPDMSPYLLVFFISNYQYVSESADGKVHGVFIPPNSQYKGLALLRNSIKSVDALSKYLEIPYSLPKLDYISIEAKDQFVDRKLIDFENWGLITYNYNKILPSKSIVESFDQFILQTHGISHQWFGNLVTPKEWKYTWLSEGMAEYFSYITTDLVFPNNKVMDYFISNILFEIRTYDIYRSITYDNFDENDVKKSYNIFTYKHGAALIRMIHHAIGDKTFKKGIYKYLNKHKFSVVVEDDLFAALQEAVDEDNVEMFKNHILFDVMRNWAHNKGYPSLTVIRNYENDTITIRQKPRRKEDNHYWWIPLNFVTASNPNFENTKPDYLMPPQSEVTINLKDLGIQLSESDWLIVNKQLTGFYSVLYDSRNLELISKALNVEQSKIHPINRAQIYRDVTPLFLGEMSLIDIETQFAILKSLKYEKDPLPWQFASDYLVNDVQWRLRKTPANETYKLFVRDIIGGIFHKIFYTPKDQLSLIDISLRPKIHKLSCEAGLKECFTYTKNVAMEYFLNDVEIDDIKSEDYIRFGINHTKFIEFQKMVDEVFRNTNDTEKYSLFLASLQFLQSMEKINYFLKVFTEKEFPTEEIALTKMKEIPFYIMIIEYIKGKFPKKGEEILIKIFEEMGKENVVFEKYSKEVEDKLFALLKNYVEGQQ